MKISTPTQKDPSIITDVFEFDEVHFSGKLEQVMFRIKKGLCINLWNSIMAAEQAVALMIRDLSEEYFKKLPKVCQEIYNDFHAKKSLIRSNYWGMGDNDDDMFFLKGNLPNIILTDFSGNPIEAKTLGQGKYQFAIRANLVYFGQHSDHTCMANLQLRISHIRFTPLTKMLDSETEEVEDIKWNESPKKQPQTEAPLERKKRACAAPKKTTAKKRSVDTNPFE